MCGRVFVKTKVDGLVRAFAFAREGEAKSLDNAFPHFNGAPGQNYPIIVREPDTGGGAFMRARWGLIPRWVKEPKGGRRPINATIERVATAPMFRGAYRWRRALLPIDGFFEWRAIKGEKVKQPYAIAMADGSPFALAAVWENWRHPATGEEIRTFAVLTCPANELVGQIHDRMPVIMASADYARWLSEEPDPSDLLKPYPSELMTVWPISTRVNRPANNGPDILDPLGEE
jgi:putative SOS response-associated peptidase YedK